MRGKKVEEGFHGSAHVYAPLQAFLAQAKFLWLMNQM